MTEVAFHFGAPDKIAYACRLLRKAVGSGAQVVVIAEPDVCAQLDSDLWALAPTEFVPHCSDSAAQAVLRHSPVMLTTNRDVVAASGDQVLVQLAHPTPHGAQSFSRVIELVSLDEGDRLLGRQRWKSYLAAGLTITRHDIAVRG